MKLAVGVSILDRQQTCGIENHNRRRAWNQIFPESPNKSDYRHACMGRPQPRIDIKCPGNARQIAAVKRISRMRLGPVNMHGGGTAQRASPRCLGADRSGPPLSFWLHERLVITQAFEKDAKMMEVLEQVSDHLYFT